MNVPKLRFKEFTEDWNKKTVSQICEVFGRIGYRGYTVNDIVSKEIGVLTLSPGNITSFNTIFSKNNDTYITKEKYEESPEIKVYNGDILFVKTGSTLGKFCYVENLNEPATINPQLIVINNPKLNPRFISLLLGVESFQKQIARTKIGGAVPTLTQQEFRNYIIHIPSSEEAKKISDFFMLMDKKIQLQQQKIDLLQEQKKGFLQKMFPKAGETQPEMRFKKFTGNWESRKLGEIATTTIGEFVIKTKQNDNNLYPVYNGGVTYTGKYDDYNNEGPKVVISARGANAGFVNIVNGKYWAGNSCYSVGVSDENKYNIEFLYQYIKRNQWLFTAYQQAANIPSVSKADVEKFEILYPCFEEQKKISTFFKQLDDTIALYQQKLDFYKEQKKGFMQQMFI